MYKEDKKTNMGRKQIDLKLPEDLLQAVQAKADQEQTSATEIVRQALTSYLSTETARLKELEQDVANIKARLKEQRQDVANNTEHIFVLSEQISKNSKKLEEKEFNYKVKVKEIKSLRPTHRSTKPHSVAYGWGEAASTYPGWEPSANISYVLDQFRILNTDEARAAFADKWLGLCVQSLNGVLPICYKLMGIMEDQEMYKFPHWMEGNRTYNSFDHYFKYRFNKLFDNWSKMEHTYQFIVDFCPQEILDKLLPIEEDGELDEKFHSDFVQKKTDAVLSLNGGAKSNQEDTEQLTKSVINGLQKMTTQEVVNFCGLSKRQVDRRRQEGRLPLEIEVEGVMYSIDYKKRNLWLVKPKDGKANSPESLPYQKKQPQPTEIKSELTQTALSKKLHVCKKTLKSKQTNLSESEFAEWTASKDPDGVAWVYSDTLKKYHPLN